MTVGHLWLNGSPVDLDTGKKSYANNFDKKTPDNGSRYLRVNVYYSRVGTRKDTLHFNINACQVLYLETSLLAGCGDVL